MGFLLSLKDWAYRKRITIVRRSIVVVVFVLLNSILFGMFSFGRHPLLRFLLLPNASCRYIVNAPTYCYYYQMQNWLTGGWSSSYQELLIPILVIFILILAFGRGWCSWLCPFGLVQEIIMSIRALIGVPHVPLRYKWVKFLDQLKYAILFFTLLIALSLGIPHLGLQGGTGTFSLPYCQICPAKGFFTLFQMSVLILPMSWQSVPSWLQWLPFFIQTPLEFALSVAYSLPWLAWLMLVIFVIGSFFIRMFWCRICPMGAVMGLMNKFSLFWLKKEPSKCTKCRICLRVCPQDFQDVYEEMDKKNITGAECTMCGRCVESCPEKGALSFNFLNFSFLKSKPRR